LRSQSQKHQAQRDGITRQRKTKEMDTDRGKQLGQLEGALALTSDARGSGFRRGRLLHHGNEARARVSLEYIKRNLKEKDRLHAIDQK